ncbi:hypothetical protein QO200_07305 [Flavobacterium sp. Arc3]|uniref:hypothetical protein n=1 Tax=Flavobacterium sp. Arc3 TaxID=3046686 RepID=UPI00352F0F3F
MNRTLQNSANLILRHLFTIVAILVVLFSSCSIKNEIKEIIGIPIAMEKGTNQRANLFSSTISNLCDHSLATDLLQSAKITLLTVNLAAIATLSSIVLLLFSVSEKEKRKHPFYNSLKISDSFPIFLLYRKLII